MLWHVCPTCITGYWDSFSLLLKYTFPALKHYDNCGNFSYYWAACGLGESGRAHLVWINAELEAQRRLPMASCLTAGRVKGLAGGLELREVPKKKKGKWEHPRHFQQSSCVSDHILRDHWMPFLLLRPLFPQVPLHWVPPRPVKLRGRSKSHLLDGKGAPWKWLDTVPPFGYCSYHRIIES